MTKETNQVKSKQRKKSQRKRIAKDLNLQQKGSKQIKGGVIMMDGSVRGITKP